MLLPLLFVPLFLIFVIPLRFIYRLQRRKRRLLKYVGHLPSPRELPIVGSGLRFVWKNSEDVMKDTIDFMSSHKTPFYAWIGRYLLVVVDKPEDAFTILTSKNCMEKAATYKYFNRIGLLTAPVHIWKPQRKILNAAFNIHILQTFIPIFNEKVKYLSQNIDCFVDKGIFDILQLLHACTLDMIC
ncbi:Cytochrome P450 4g1, partial [Pseudolycoriella hygida]